HHLQPGIEALLNRAIAREAGTAFERIACLGLRHSGSRLAPPFDLCVALLASGRRTGLLRRARLALDRWLRLDLIAHRRVPPRSVRRARRFGIRIDRVGLERRL